MPAPHASYGFQEQQVAGQYPLKMVGGNNFGRYPKVSQEQTWNFIVSDRFLVPYSGYSRVVSLSATQKGRAASSSTIGGIIVAVIGGSVFKINNRFEKSIVGQLATTAGNVFIRENNAFQICITDGIYIYVYNYNTGVFYSSQPGSTNMVDFPPPLKNPGFISFQNGRFIVVCNSTQTWALSEFNNGTKWFFDASHIGTLSSKPSYIQAVAPVPGGGNNVLVFGSNVAESWQDLGLAQFPYQRNSTFNIDYGCINPASIASLENFVVWLSINENSGVSLSFTSGGPVQRISTDGIDFKLAKLTNPSNCFGFLFRQDGHVIYQFTFIDDNLSYAYDFNTSLFFNVSDENLNYHIALQVVFFNNGYYFVSLNDGNLYAFDTKYTNADYGNGNIQQIPRIRITPPMRLPDQRYFIGKSVAFTLEQGQENTPIPQTINIPGGDTICSEDFIDITAEDGVLIASEGISSEVIYAGFSEAVDMSMSRDGAYTFGSSIRKFMNPTGRRLSRFNYQRLGVVNDASFQFRFYGFNRFVVTDGIIGLYQ